MTPIEGFEKLQGLDINLEKTIAGLEKFHSITRVIRANPMLKILELRLSNTPNIRFRIFLAGITEIKN